MVLACAGTHNFLRKECLSDKFPIEVVVVDDQPSDMDDDNHGLNFSSQQRQRAEANTCKANIANSMCNDRPRTGVNEEDDEDPYNENEDANNE